MMHAIEINLAFRIDWGCICANGAERSRRQRKHHTHCNR